MNIPDRPGPIAVSGPVSALTAIATAAAIGDIDATPLTSASPHNGQGTTPSPVPNPAPTTTTLSDAARVLTALLTQAGNTMPQVVASRPLLAAALPDPAAIAGALQRGIDASGLFYESHLARWHGGGYDLTSIRQEPQAATKPAHVAEYTTDSAVIASIVRTQLDTLETGRIHWQGELWPGLSMDWTISKADAHRETFGEHHDDAKGHRDEHQNADNDSTEHRAWQSTLRLTLPALGTIQARLRLDGEQLGITLEASQTESAGILKRHRHALSAGLDSAGMALEAYSVQRSTE